MRPDRPVSDFKRYTNLTLAWLRDVLGPKFEEDKWKVIRHDAPRQNNGYDCGVFTITNAMCIALGLSPIDSYREEDMPAQRIRIACMLLNNGFSGDFDLKVY
jgi:Ulp1 family protease